MKSAQTFLSHQCQKLYFSFVKKIIKSSAKGHMKKTIVTLFLNFLMLFFNIRDVIVEAGVD